MRNGWAETTLGDIADVLSGFAFKSELFSEKEGIPLIRIRDLQKQTWTEVGYVGDFDERYVVKKGDFLIGMDGEFCCYEWLGGNALLNQRVCRIQDFALTQIIPRFIYFLVNNYLGEIEKSTSFTTVKHISIKQVKEISFPLPPLVEQGRIVDVVSSVDAYIDSLQLQAATARTARNAVLHELLSAGGDGWTETTLGDVALLNPKESALSADAPFIPMDAVHVGKRYVQYHEPRGERSGARANIGDILFARITPCLENGKVAQIQNGIERCGGSTEFIVIRGTKVFDSGFAYFWATWTETRNRAAGLMTGTTGRQRLSASDLGAMSVSLPPLVEQKRIVEIVSSMDDVIQTTEQAIADAKNLRSGLLSDLLSGEHEIPESYDKFVGAA